MYGGANKKSFGEMGIHLPCWKLCRAVNDFFPLHYRLVVYSPSPLLYTVRNQSLYLFLIYIGNCVKKAAKYWFWLLRCLKMQEVEISNDFHYRLWYVSYKKVIKCPLNKFIHIGNIIDVTYIKGLTWLHLITNLAIYRRCDNKWNENKLAVQLWNILFSEDDSNLHFHIHDANVF